MRIRLGLILTGAVFAASGFAYSAQSHVISGAVQYSQTFESPIDDTELVFTLRPSTDPNPRGWTIEIYTDANRHTELSGGATPPFRFSNPRYIDTGYGKGAEALVAWSPRSFHFFMNITDTAHANELVGKILWPPEGQTSQERQSLIEEWEALPKGDGVLEIVDAEIAYSETHPEGWVSTLEFQVEFTLP